MEALDLTFGWRSALLGAAVVQCTALAIALARSPVARSAHRWLALAIGAIAGVILPYAIGFAGFYDAFRWLTFLPVAVPLAIGPCLYLYARTSNGEVNPRSAVLHLAPAGLQFAYSVLAFLLPMPEKWAWYVGGHRAWIAPAFELLTPISLAVYAVATWCAILSLRRRLAEQRSDDDRYGAAWLTRVLAGLMALVLLETGFWLWSALTGGIDYFQETGLFLGLAVVGIYLGVEGWRQSALGTPLLSVETQPDPRPVVDWTELAEEIQFRTREAQWWKDPALNLPRLARLMGTNTGRVSRAINLGLGVNFSAFVNGLRAEALAEALHDGRREDLTALAFEMGFASKASFNRAFKARFGVSPSRYRRDVSDPEFLQKDRN